MSGREKVRKFIINQINDNFIIKIDEDNINPNKNTSKQY